MFVRWKKHESLLATERAIPATERGRLAAAREKNASAVFVLSWMRRDGDLDDESNAALQAQMDEAWAAISAIRVPHRVYDLEAALVASYRNEAGKPRQQNVAYLGRIRSDQLTDEDTRMAFWCRVRPILEQQAMTDAERARAIAKLEETVPAVDEALYRGWERWRDLAWDHPEAAQTLLKHMVQSVLTWSKPDAERLLRARFKARESARTERAHRDWATNHLNERKKGAEAIEAYRAWIKAAREQDQFDTRADA